MCKLRKVVCLLTVLLSLAVCAVVLSCNDPPGIGIHTPGDGVTVSATTPITAEVTSETEVKGVDIYVDGKLLASLSEQPYQYDWDTTAETDGTHKVYAKARALRRADGVSKTISVTAKN